MKFISHCHSHHSFDSALVVSDIVEQLHLNNIDAVIICDHDVYELDESEERRFADANIQVYKGIEFTTFEGVHVIGVHKFILELQKPAYSYHLLELLNELRIIDAVVIFPHPSHATGLMGNRNTDTKIISDAIRFSHFFEVDNYRYGSTFPSDIQQINKLKSNVGWVIGSDAHRKTEVSAYINEVEGEFDLYCSASGATKLIRFIYKQKRAKLYFKIKRFQKTNVYQRLIGILSSETRTKIKVFFGLR